MSKNVTEITNAWLASLSRIMAAVKKQHLKIALPGYLHYPKCRTLSSGAGGGAARGRVGGGQEKWSWVGGRVVL